MSLLIGLMQMMIKSIDFFEIYIILSPYFWSCFWKILY